MKKSSGNSKAIWIDPDLDFIFLLSKYGEDFYKKCFQCGTCSATCALSPDYKPFPSKEMAWATWGMKDQLLKDPDVWLCYQCNDCSVRCPRGARPGDILAAVRKESIIKYAVPRFLGRWVHQPKFLPLLLGIPAALLGLALTFKEPLGNALGFSAYNSNEIVYSYSSVFPHWLLNGFFLFFSFLVVLALIGGVARFWKAMKTSAVNIDGQPPAKGIFPSIGTAIKEVITHDKFSKCEQSRSRLTSHLLVFFGFIGLSVVTLWIITSGINPIIQGKFVYPFNFWSPWKLLANLGGLALLAGLVLMIRNRLIDKDHAGASGYFDWTFIWVIMAVVLTGFITEVLHYIRLEPHRHVIYFVHLVFVSSFLLYLPYSKFAHIIYRTTALVYAEHTGRKRETETAGEKMRSDSNAAGKQIISESIDEPQSEGAMQP
ncbi:MAG: heterodisulfide reductase subunit E [candidate division Zixibacteria bacterium]|nr:heterodisulfide reductase subunit E [candidate division Zixibacteria bacterium]NIS15554.1 heterodisulfide reductase subunit E [candidate division Zixibacteria bacterium]NIS49084.1 heterodisulfide reductase subunit E [candidate division Zixibacteria bacterium]NIT52079.1 heterodisulfide reductase subunit E [candidate division Zixibacteria bacterium]NIU17170.1 heterodisulfide reductase subunit E [candidate division Zixibacteria bacterium]